MLKTRRSARIMAALRSGPAALVAATLVALMAPAMVMADLFPQDAAYYRKIGEEFGATRLWAGIHFQSDIDAGYAIGRGVAMKTVARARSDGAW